MTPQNSYPISVPRFAVALRRLFGRWQHIRGIPRLLYWLRFLAFSTQTALVNTPDGLPITIKRDDYGHLMLFYFPYCSELRCLLQDILLPGDVCLDLGSNVGLLSAAMAQLVGSSGVVIAVDPNNEVTDCLFHTIHHCALTQIQVVRAGIAGKPGLGQLSIPTRGFSESVEIAEVITVDDMVRLVTVDMLVEELSPHRTPDFIKVDIEGSEVELLDSMKSLMTKGVHPILLIEFHANKCLRRGVAPEQIREALWLLGYEERWVSGARDNYRLEDWRDKPVNHGNMLYMTPAQIAACPRLSANWT